MELPDELAKRLGGVADLSRRPVEGFALEEYKAGRVSKAELRQWLGFGARYELDGFLKAHDVFAEVSLEELRRDVHDLEKLGL